MFHLGALPLIILGRGAGALQLLLRLSHRGTGFRSRLILVLYHAQIALIGGDALLIQTNFFVHDAQLEVVFRQLGLGAQGDIGEFRCAGLRAGPILFPCPTQFAP